MAVTPDNEQARRLDPARLREICWELGASFPARPAGDRLILTAVHPRLAYLAWSLDEATVSGAQRQLGDRFSGARLVVRVYDVTDVVFDGFNAHSFLDVPAPGLGGRHYLPVRQTDRNLLAEVGFVLRDQGFFALARAEPRYFDRDRPSPHVTLGGLFVSSDFRYVFPVESILDAPIFERLNAALPHLERSRPLRVAVVDAGLGAALTGVVRRLGGALGKVRADVSVFADEAPVMSADDIVAQAQRRSAHLYDAVAARHADLPFDLMHCHEWYSVPAALRARELGVPLVLSLHSTEQERAHGAPRTPLSEAICDWERRGVTAAALVIVPRSSTRQQLIGSYGANPERVTIVSDVLEDPHSGAPESGDAKRGLGLDPSGPVALFANELSHAAGADLLVDALTNVAREHTTVQFVIAGDGPLKGELEARVGYAGLAHRCRFLGDVPGDRFGSVLLASDFVVIPARTWQDEGLAQLAIAHGKPVLTTRQANLNCVQHGQTGLVTYDNPGSIVWGIKELLANPLRGNLLRLLARRKAEQTPSFDRATVEHYLAYEQVVAAPEVGGSA